MKEFKFYITDKDGKSFYESEGFVGTQGNPRELEDAPEGFQDIAIAYERNITYHGLFRSFSFPLGFVKSGASILKHIYHKLGREFKAYLILLKYHLLFDDDNFQELWKSYYKGEFDLSTYMQEENKVTVSLLDGGLESLIKANENTVYEISLEGEVLPGDEVKTNTAVEMDGLNLLNTIQYVITDGYIMDNYPYRKSHLVELQEVYREVADIGGVKPVTRTRVANNNSQIQATGEWFMRSTTNREVTIEYDFSLTRSNVGGLTSTLGMTCTVVIRAINNGATSPEKNKVIFQTTQPWELLGTNNIKGSVTIPLSEGDEVYLYTMVNPQGSGANTDENVNFTYSGEGLFKVSYQYRHPTSYAAGLYPDILFQRLIEKISDGKYSADTTFLRTKRQYFITSGDALRGISGAVIKTSFADFWQWIWSTEDVYFGVKDKTAVIGSMNDVYKLPYHQTSVRPRNPGGTMVFDTSAMDMTRVVDVGEVRNLKVSPAKDFMFSSIKAGYPKQSYEDVNGRSETNQGQQWTTPVTRSSTSLDLVSPYRADPYGAEYVRINFMNKSTTDAESDNDTFVLHVERSFQRLPAVFVWVNLHKLDRTANAYVTGVKDPVNLFNIQLSPKHNLLRKGRFLRSCLDKLDDQVIKFQSADRNKDMVVNYPNGSVVESADIPISTLGEKYFIPDILEYETNQPVNLVESMNENKTLFLFEWNGVKFTGFVMKAGIALWDNEVQTHQLISSPINDLSKI